MDLDSWFQARFDAAIEDHQKREARRKADRAALDARRRVGLGRRNAARLRHARQADVCSNETELPGGERHGKEDR